MQQQYPPTNDSGIVNGCYYGQMDRVDELNGRIQNRQLPDIPLRPNYDPRPVDTKRSRFPIIDRRKPVKESQYGYLDNSMANHFYPASKNGPPKEYLEQIDTETWLRNQTVALQHGANQGVYVPSSNSDLYKPTITPPPTSLMPLHPLLRPDLSSYRSSGVVDGSIGKDSFFNHTRTQLRNTGSQQM